ncbi:TadE/TadG family type IV pilus assembly protein [Streptomyces sp. N35]|uniref:TadE/TadG family type IV pilus assembly protein n=1 Tax=Streptomyces sp. N35 TaxID=2795730 RepID=UPI0018F5E3AA|nr:TadE/TadG family type IV pilus assembly protein [Streptomyces sp. N35]
MNRWAERLRNDDRGSSPVQMAIIMPIALLFTLCIVQGFMWSYARHAAYAAARDGLQAGRMYEATPADGAAHAREALDRYAGDFLSNRTVSSAGSTAETVEIRVHGTAISMIPGIDSFQINAVAAGPVERWTVPGED